MTKSELRRVKFQRPTPKSGEIWWHFKGNAYRIIDIATHSETNEEMIIYSRVKDNSIWTRPLDMFMSEVDHEKYPDVEQKWRFEKRAEYGEREESVLNYAYKEYDALVSAANKFRDLIQAELIKTPRNIQSDFVIHSFNALITETINMFSRYACLCKTKNEVSLLHAVTCNLLAKVEDFVYEMVILNKNFDFVIHRKEKK